ncbi:MAG TPA: hypothetical protein ENN19_04105 [Chloroflexi bacterium]|nr:hypothetical protein [Chloroflexota bacterium]
MISEKTVADTWQRMSQTSIHQISQLVNQMRVEQPVVMSYLLNLDDFPFTQHERELIFYIGMVAWQMMKRGKKQLYQVTAERLREAEDFNIAILDRLSTTKENRLIEITQIILQEYSEPEVLHYIVEAIMEKDIEEPGFRDEYTGLAFVHLKIILDALIASLAPRPRMVA